jgi:hypothetical protein
MPSSLSSPVDKWAMFLESYIAVLLSANKLCILKVRAPYFVRFSSAYRIVSYAPSMGIDPIDVGDNRALIRPICRVSHFSTLT